MVDEPILDQMAVLRIGGGCFGRAVRRTANLLTRTYNAYLAPAGIEITQFSILCIIARGDATSASELADFVGVERSTGPGCDAGNLTEHRHHVRLLGGGEMGGGLGVGHRQAPDWCDGRGRSGDGRLVGGGLLTGGHSVIRATSGWDKSQYEEGV